MIEPARMVATGKVKTDITTAKRNITFWNELHRLGLTNMCEKPNAATWNIANCVIALCKIEARVTEIHLIVARRQVGYRWVYGFQPDESARASWNRILQLIQRETWDQPMHLLEQPLAQMRNNIAELTGPSQRSELARLVRISEIAQAHYGTGVDGRATPKAIRHVEELIVQAETFRHEQEQLADFTLEQLADAFLQMIPESKSPAKRVRRRTKTKPTQDDKDNVNPKRKTTEAEWRRDWQLIEPLFNQRQKIGVIADHLQMTRERVSAIIQWATAKPK